MEKSEFGEIQFFIDHEGQSMMALELFEVQSSPFVLFRPWIRLLFVQTLMGCPGSSE